MAKNCRNWYWRLGLGSWLAIAIPITSENWALAQITPDATLGAESSIVTPTNANGLPGNQIDGGATRGANLFHSFDEFSIPTGSEAFFNNALDIQNIISRVTGSSISNIDGLLRANGTANLFLLNPNGIVFGPNASLSIGGSFVGSTASSLNFADGTSFSATAPTTTPLLTVSVPIGLQYGGTTGSILNQSQATDSSGQVIGLQVLPSRTLALAGGEVKLDSGSLQAPGGQVELGGVASSGTVGLNFDNSALGLSFPDGIERADVSLTNGAAVDVTAGGGGSVAVNARNLDILGGSSLSAGIGPELGTVGSQAGDITLNATGVTTISQSSSVTNNFAIDATGGEAGDINIKTGSLLINDFARVNTLQDRENAQGQGNSGNITVLAFGDVFLDTTDSELNSALSTFSLGGNAGNVSVEASGSVSVSSSEIITSSFGGSGGTILLQANGGSISVTNNSAIASNVFDGQGDAGKISLIANGSISIANISYITSSVDIAGEPPSHTGNGGDIYIQGQSLSVTGGSQLANRTFSIGNAGRIEVDTSDFVEVSGRYPVIRPTEVSGIPKITSSARLNGEGYSGFSTTSEEGANGSGGDISITTGILRVSDGGTLDAQSRSTLRGGTINVNANVLEVTGGGQLLTTAFSSGNAGDINVNATDRITITGSNLTFSNILNELIELTGEEEAESSIGPIGPDSGLFASANEQSTGQGGSLRIEAGQLNVQDGAEVNVSSAGAGAAGNLTVSAESIGLDNRSSILATTVAGNQGNIILNSDDLVLRRGSKITTNAIGTATGGNITIDTGVMAALENSEITARAEQGQGGNIRITTQGIFRSSESFIDASSDLGIDGEVEINTLDVDPSQGLVTLPEELVDVSNSIAQGCPASVRSGESKFVITGRGGLPPNPNEPLTGDNVLTEWSTLDSDVENRSDAAPDTDSTSTPTQIVEANAMVKGPNGQITLIANAPNANQGIPWLPSSQCRAAETGY